jgi:cation diffusion facilitator CzcD-associated flavoprotein CzcO
VPEKIDAVIVGAGFAGMYMLYRLRSAGFKPRTIEAAADVGGTWLHNRYPGCRCDVESLEYCYWFSEELQQEWEWTEKFAAQPEILAYARHVADRFDLRRDICFNTRVQSATFNEYSKRWLVKTDTGVQYDAHYFICATGALSTPKTLDLKGLSSFSGNIYHTANWPREGAKIAGRVGVIGTGSTGIQLIPVVAATASHLTVFQRTANYCVPAGNHPLDVEYKQIIKSQFQRLRDLARVAPSALNAWNPKSALEVTPEERRRTYEDGWKMGGVAFMGSFSDLMTNGKANETASEFLRSKIRQIVRNPEVAKMLAPTDHPLGSRRICTGTNYYETFNRDNVLLVDIRSAPIVEVTPEGIRTTQGDYALDTLILATGFDALTGPLFAMEIRGKSGIVLQEKWSAGPSAYLGLCTAEFPNMFIITGAGSPSVLSNVMISIEQSVEWIASCIEDLRARRKDSIEASAASETEWMAKLQTMANATVLTKANSWWNGANIPGKPRVFTLYVGGVAAYRAECDAAVANDYRGFVMSAASVN